MASEPPTDAVRGILHSYQSSPGLTAFEIVEHERHEKVVIFIGGLSDSYLTVPYLRPLGRELAREGWGVVQVTLSSSALGYGTTSLAKDVEELANCVKYFRAHGKTSICLWGHSTGTQDIMTYLEHIDARPSIEAAVLQAPLSDREFMEYVAKREGKSLDQWLDLAKKYISLGQGDEMMPREASRAIGSAALTAYRFHSLAGFMGDDDLFSSDLPAERAKSIWTRAPHLPLLVLSGDKDQYYPPHVNSTKLLQDWSKLREDSRSRFVIIKGANHQAADPDAQQDMFSVARSFIKGLKTDSG